jgi:ankyrin repeat protein
MADNAETRTAFLDAVRGNDIVTVGRLLDEHADLLNVRVKPDEVYSATALVVAIEAQHVDMVRYLVERGADTETGYWDGHALLAAVCGSDAEILEIFLPEGTDLSELWDNNEDSMLHHACMSGSTAVVKRLLRQHPGPCDWLDLRNAPGRTAFREACRRERTDVMRALLLSRANHTLADYNNESPREVAERKKGHKGCLALMKVRAPTTRSSTSRC